MPTISRIPLSVRIDQEEADFIADLKIEGANTPSEKIRELLKRARIEHTRQQDYAYGLDTMEQFLLPARHNLLHAEKKQHVHSPLLARVFDLLPDLLAVLAVDIPPDADLATLKSYEKEVIRRISRLSDSILQLTVTGKGAAYDDAVLAELDNTLALAHIAKQRQSSEK